MHRTFETELRELTERLVYMGGIAEKMIDLAIQDLVQRKDTYEKSIAQYEDEVNALQIEIDERVIRLLALQHPVASDLRLLVMASKIAGELERIGDLAVNLMENTRLLLQYPQLKPLLDIPRMAEVARRMLRESLDAFVRKDVPLASKVLDSDDEVDGLKDQVFNELLTYMLRDPQTIQRALALILISRNLERVADHATNIAEEAIYLVAGRDVRHHHTEAQQ